MCYNNCAYPKSQVWDLAKYHTKANAFWTEWYMRVSKLAIIGSDNGLSPGQRHDIIWTNAGILIIRTSGTNINEILNEIHAFFQENAVENVVCEMAVILTQPRCANWWPRCKVAAEQPIHKEGSIKTWNTTHGPISRYVKLRVAHAPGMPGTFPHHRGLAIPTCITARAWRTCRDACRDRRLAVSVEDGHGGGENFPGIPGPCATPNFTYLVRGPCVTYG